MPAQVGSHVTSYVGGASGDPAPTSFAGSISRTGAGSLTLSGRPAHRGSIALTGAGSLTLTGSAGTSNSSHSGSIALSATGTLALSGRPDVRGSLARTGSGTLTLSNYTRELHSGTIARTNSGRLIMSGFPVFNPRWRYRALRRITFGPGGRVAIAYNRNDVVPDIVVANFNLYDAVTRVPQ